MGKHIRNFKHKMKYLVTGGAGFIGSNLVDKLISLGHDVICIDDESAECHEQFYWNDKAQNYKHDICDYDLIAPLFKDVDCVFHVASDARIQPAILNPKKSIQSNAVGTANVIHFPKSIFNLRCKNVCLCRNHHSLNLFHAQFQTTNPNDKS